MKNKCEDCKFKEMTCDFGRHQEPVERCGMYGPESSCKKQAEFNKPYEG